MIFSSYSKLNLYIQRHFKTLWPFLSIRKIINILVAVCEMNLRKIKCFSKPFIYRIDPCSACNLRCPSCVSHTTCTKEKRVMTFADYTQIIDKIKPVALRASLYDMGEPLANKDIYQMIKYASDHKISTLISTNFNLFKTEDLKPLFDSKLTVLEPCLDGFTQASYGQYRVGGNVENVKNSIKQVMDYKRQTKAKWPVVDVQVVKFDHIKDELALVDKFLKQDCQVDQVTYRQENLGFNSAETTSANKNEDTQKPCFWLYLGMMIRPDGNVYPCCGRGFDRLSYGNLLTQNLDQIWNNKFYQFSRALFTAGPDLPYDPEMANIPCLNCPYFKRKRKMANTIDKNPKM